MPTINSFLSRFRKNKYHCNSVKVLKSNPQKKGVCIKPRIAKPKKPNSAQRKIVKVRLSVKRNILAYIPGQGHNLKSYFSVLIQGGRANDLPGVRFSLMRGKYDFSSKENFIRLYKRSKYGLQRRFKEVINNSDDE
jgi:small subunit ribosomal protein S12